MRRTNSTLALPIVIFILLNLSLAFPCPEKSELFQTVLATELLFWCFLVYLISVTVSLLLRDENIS